MVHRVFNSAQYLLVNVHHVVNGGQYVNQMARSVDYSAYLVNTALESIVVPDIEYVLEDAGLGFQIFLKKTYLLLNS